MGCPIRKPPDQSLFAAPRSISLLTTSFIAGICQVILYRPLVACSINYDGKLGFIVLLIPITVKEHDRYRVRVTIRNVCSNLVVPEMFKWS